MSKIFILKYDHFVSHMTTFGVFTLVDNFFPQSEPKEVEQRECTCLHEENYSGKKKRGALARLRMYDRVSVVRSDLNERVSKTVGQGKKAFSTPPHRGRSFWIAEDESLNDPPNVNEEVQRITGNKHADSPSITIPAKDLRKLERCLLAMQENQSLFLWIISTLFSMLHKSGVTSSARLG